MFKEAEKEFIVFREQAASMDGKSDLYYSLLL